MKSDERSMSRQFPPTHGMDAPLLAYRSGWTTRETFLYELMDSRVLVLADAVDHDDDQASTRPLILRRAGGMPLLAVFSSPELAAEWAKAYPSYRQTLEVNTSEVLVGLPDDHGIVIDPGDGNELELQPGELDAFRFGMPAVVRPGLH